MHNDVFVCTVIAALKGRSTAKEWGGNYKLGGYSCVMVLSMLNFVPLLFYFTGKWVATTALSFANFNSSPLSIYIRNIQSHCSSLFLAFLFDHVSLHNHCKSGMDILRLFNYFTGSEIMHNRMVSLPTPFNVLSCVWWQISVKSQ